MDFNPLKAKLCEKGLFIFNLINEYASNDNVTVDDTKKSCSVKFLSILGFEVNKMPNYEI